MAALVCVARCESLTQVSAINEAMKCATAIRMACHADYMGANVKVREPPAIRLPPATNGETT